MKCRFAGVRPNGLQVAGKPLRERLRVVAIGAGPEVGEEAAAPGLLHRLPMTQEPETLQFRMDRDEPFAGLGLDALGVSFVATHLRVFRDDDDRNLSHVADVINH
jgi:hypothetical protein